MSKLRTWHVFLYVVILSFIYMSAFTYLWLSGGNPISYLFHVESLAMIIFGGALQSVVIWYLIVKIVDCLNEYLPISGGKRAI